MVATGSLSILVETKLTTLVFITCSLKSTVCEAVKKALIITHPPTNTIVLAKDFIFFFFLHSLEDCPPQRNRGHYLNFNSNTLSI